MYYIGTGDKLQLNVAKPLIKSNSILFMANPHSKDKKKYYGLLSVNGKVHNLLPAGLPCVVKNKSGDVFIRKEATVDDIGYAEYVVGAAALLAYEGVVFTLASIRASTPCKINVDKIAHRTVLCTLTNNTLLFINKRCVLQEILDMLYAFRVTSAVLLNTYECNYVKQLHDDDTLDYKTELPYTTFTFSDVSEMLRPLIVIDQGHGGTDTGTVENGLREKDLTYDIASHCYTYLFETYICTPLLLNRDIRLTLSDKTRCAIANSLGADMFVSVHNNQNKDAEIKGVTTHVATKAVLRATQVSKTIHASVVDYLIPMGTTDNGYESRDYTTLTDTKMPAVLIDILHITNVEDAQLLSNNAVRHGIGVALAKGIARGMKLTKKERSSEPIIEAPKETRYVVTLGTFKSKTNADNLADKLHIISKMVDPNEILYAINNLGITLYEAKVDKK